MKNNLLVDYINIKWDSTLMGYYLFLEGQKWNMIKN